MSVAVLENFYSENFERLCKTIRFRGCTPADAEDVVQEAFTRALTYIKTFREEREEFGAWFNSILNNALRSFKKEEKLQGATNRKDEEFEEEEDASIPVEILENCRKIIRETIDAANPEHKRILELFFTYQYKPREIEEILDAKGTTVRQVVFRCRQKVIDTFDASLRR